MIYQEGLISLFPAARRSLFAYALALPIELLSYAPEKGMRTPLQLLREAVQMIGYVAELLEKGPEGADYAASAAASQGWTGVEDCERAFDAAWPMLETALRGFPEQKLNEAVSLPWGAMPWSEVLAYPYWNMRYHEGQIAYVQLVHGDGEFHG